MSGPYMPISGEMANMSASGPGQGLDNAQKALQLGSALQNYYMQALKNKYGPSELFNQNMQSNTSTIRGMRPYDAALTESMMKKVSAPVEEVKSDIDGQINAIRSKYKAPEPAPINPSHNPSIKGQVEQVRGRFPQSTQSTEAYSSKPGTIFGGYGVDDMVKGPPSVPSAPPQTPPATPQAPQAPAAIPPDQGQAPAPRGPALSMADPMVVAKFAQGIDPNSLMSTDTEKILPAALSATAMGLRNVPSAYAGMANAAGNQANQSAMEQAKILQAANQATSKQEHDELMGLIKGYVDMNKPHGAGGAGKKLVDPNIAADQRQMGELDKAIARVKVPAEWDRAGQKKYDQQVQDISAGFYKNMKTQDAKNSISARFPKASFGQDGGGSAQPPGNSAPPASQEKMVGKIPYVKHSDGKWYPK